MVIMVRWLELTFERRMNNREIFIKAVRKVISDKCEKSEVITEFGILFYLLLLLVITFYLPVLTHFMFYVTKINPVSF